VGKPEDRFAEDLLRVLRGLRFSGRFDMEIDEGTWRALCGATSDLGILSPERVREELEKVLSESVRPSGPLTLYLASGVMGALYPELAALLGRPRPATEEDLLIHSFLLADALPQRWPILRLAALLHGLGAQEDVDLIAALMLRLRFSNADTGAVLGLVRAGLEPPLEITGPPAFRRWLHTAGRERAKDIFRIWLAKARLDAARLERTPDSVLALIRSLRRELQEGPPLELEDLAIGGRDLIGMGLKPGPYFGRILSYLLDRVLEDPRENDPSRLRDLVESGLEEGRFEER
jgi:tRNA nucleotidyltransferase (CCA-adding enzyme)